MPLCNNLVLFKARLLKCCINISFSPTTLIFLPQTDTSANLLKKKASPAVGKIEKISDKRLSILPTAHMFTTRSLLQELMQLLACLEVQVKPGKRQMRRYRQMISFNVGKKSNPVPQPVCLTLIRVEAWIYCINIHADVYLISSSGRLSWTDCGSLALTLRCWQIDRWPASCPLGLLLMASMRMDGIIFKVQLVISNTAVYLLNDLLA